jgi:large subunit ribosomal protein L20
MRVKRGTTVKAKHNKIRKATKGMQAARRASIKLGKQGATKALQYAYRDRRNKKRDIRSLWITRISAAAKEHGTSYSKFIAALKTKNITLDRKILAELAVNEPASFTAVVNATK